MTANACAKQVGRPTILEVARGQAADQGIPHFRIYVDGQPMLQRDAANESAHGLNISICEVKPL